MQTKPNTNKLLLFFFSCLPGAGHMYMGFMKTGISFMALFFGIIAIGIELYMNLFFFMIPIIWFYSFFDVWKKYNMSYEEFSKCEDNYLFIGAQMNDAAKSFTEKNKNGIGIFAIIFGIYLLFRRAVFPYLYNILPNDAEIFVRQFADSLPQVIIGISIICGGFYLISGKKRELEIQKAENSKMAMAAAYAAYNKPAAPVTPVTPVATVAPVTSVTAEPVHYVDVQSDSSKEVAACGNIEESENNA